MNYFEMVEWLKQVEPNYDMFADDLKALFMQRQQTVNYYEITYAEILINTIQSEIAQIDFLNDKKKLVTDLELNYIIDEEIKEHQGIILKYQEKISHLYSKASIIASYESMKLSCQERIDFSNRVLAENPDDVVSKQSLVSDNQYMTTLDASIAILSGNMANISDNSKQV